MKTLLVFLASFIFGTPVVGAVLRSGSLINAGADAQAADVRISARKVAQGLRHLCDPSDRSAWRNGQVRSVLGPFDQVAVRRS
ncbi:MAG: hypothetical protein OXN89_02380 [Bryobacterales bacterium]|nr:hypothetical protein [Bryobacterales bacterium]